MAAVRLLPGEQIETSLKPHPLSFGGRYLMAAWPGIWGLLLFAVYHASWWAKPEAEWYEVWKWLYGNAAAGYLLMTTGLLVVGAAVAVTAIRWRLFFFYLGAAAATTVLGILVDRAGLANYATGIPVILVLLAVPGTIWTEVDRRSHRFNLTNLRILFRGGTVVSKERQLRYESITDLDASQSMLGRLLNYGTIIPVTQSGFGMGADTSQAMVGVGVGGKKGPVGGGVGVAAGGGKEVQVGRARTFHQLTGVKPFGDTKFLLESLIQNATATPYLREQVELQRKMADQMEAMNQRFNADERPDP